MELTYILIAALVIVAPVILTKLFSGRSGDTRIVLGAKPDGRPAPGPDPTASLRAEVANLLARGGKLEAI